MNAKAFQLPVYLVKKVYTAGHVADLGPLEFGIFDKKTHSVATASGNGKEFFLAGGSPHTRDNLSKWYHGMKTPKKSEPFFGKDVEAFEKISPSRPENEQWVIGYDGSKSSNTLQFEGNKTYKIKFRLYGEPIYAHFAKSLEKIVPLYTGCVDGNDCAGDPCTPEYIGVKKQTRAWAKAFNENVELSEFKLKVTPIFSDYAATAASVNDFTLSVADDGSVEALQDIERAYPGVKIEKVSSQRGVSIYVAKGLADAPADFTPKSYSVPVTNCDECTVGTFVDSVFTYIVSRPTSDTTDLNDDAARTAYAASIVTAYGGIADSGVYLGLKDGNASVKFNAAAAKTSLAADELIEIAKTSPTCTTVASDPIAWVEGKGGYTVTRTLTATFSNEDCEQAVTAEQVQEYLDKQLKNTVVVTEITDTVGTGINVDKCVTVLQVVQTSNVMQDDYCMSPDNATFEEIPNYKDGIWEENDTEEPYDASIKAGLRFTVPSNYTFFGDDSYSLDERFDKEPIRMEVSIYDENANPCTFSKIANARRVKAPKYDRLSGRYVRSEYIKRNSAYFPYEMWSGDNREREIIDVTTLGQIKADSYFVEYRLQFKEARDTHNFNQKAQHFAPRIFVEEGDLATQKALEDALHAVIGKFGVGLDTITEAK